MNKLDKAMYYNHVALDYVVSHTHDSYEIIYYAEGRGHVTIGSESYNYNKDSIAIIDENTPHEEYADTETEVYCVCIDIPEAIFESSVIHKSATDGWKFESILRSLKALEKSYKLSEDNVAYNVEQEVDNIVLMLMQILNMRQIKSDIYAQQVVESTKKYIKSNFMYKIDFNILAEQMGYSYDRFRHIFVVNYGESLYKYLSNVRLTKAKELLLKTTLTITEISQRTGYKSQIRFSTWFKEKTGLPPKEYRRIMRDPDVEPNVFEDVYRKK